MGILFDEGENDSVVCLCNQQPVQVWGQTTDATNGHGEGVIRSLELVRLDIKKKKSPNLKKKKLGCLIS